MNWPRNGKLILVTSGRLLRWGKGGHILLDTSDSLCRKDPNGALNVTALLPRDGGAEDLVTLPFIEVRELFWYISFRIDQKREEFLVDSGTS